VKRKKIAFLISTFVVVVISFFIGLNRIKIKKVECFNQFNVCNPTIVVEAARVNGKNIFLARKELDKIIKNNYLVKSYLIAYKLPTALTINLIERSPKIALYPSETNKFLLADEEGKIINMVDNSNLQKISVDRKLPNLGENIDREILFGILLTLDAANIDKIVEAKIEKNSLVISYKEGPKVTFPLDGDRKTLIGGLNLILSQLNTSSNATTIENEDLGNLKIDMRYRNPVLQYIK